MSIAAYTDKFRELVSYRPDAQTSEDVKYQYIKGLPVRKVSKKLLDAMYYRKEEGNTLDSLMSAANVSTFLHNSVRVFQGLDSDSTSKSDPMQLGAADMQSQQRRQSGQAGKANQSDKPRVNFDLSGVSQDVRQQRKSAGACLACGSKDHFLRDCPEAKPKKKQGKA
eukprot:21569-Chlamydomonas_euryale.AAC.1